MEQNLNRYKEVESGNEGNLAKRGETGCKIGNKPFKKDERGIKMRKLLVVLMAVGFCLGFAGMAVAADQTVTTQVTAINEINATGAPSLNIIEAVAGSEPTAITDSTTGDLLWTTNEATRTISVQAAGLAATCTLTVEAKNVSGTGTPGTAGAAVTLSTTAQSLITAISTTAANSDLEYVLSADAADGTTASTDVTVTFTIAASG